MNSTTFTNLIPKKSKIIDLNAIGIYGELYQSAVLGDDVRLTSVFRILLSADSPASTDRRSMTNAQIQTQVDIQRLADMLSSLYREQIFIEFKLKLTPREPESRAIYFDYVVTTWMITKKLDEHKVRDFENATATVKGAVGASIKNSKLKRLKGNELRDYIVSGILPTAPGTDVSQTTTDPAILALFVPLQAPGPQFEQVNYAPPFYIPGEDEAGGDGILLGPIRNGTALMHDFRIQMDDLKRHTCIVGMTESGKSGDAKVILRQAGLPCMVLDWHNEYAEVVTKAGGEVLTPGSGDFVINPLEPTSLEVSDHIAAVTNIFSSIYRFTFPQTWMFRNVLAKTLKDKPASTLSDFLRVMEAYPVRTDSDNYTKNALQTRLVPLTEGQTGRALNGKSTHPIDLLMSKIVAVELKSITDDQNRAIIANMLLKMIYDFQKRRGEGNGLDHLVVIEEAGNIAPPRRAEEPSSIAEIIASEGRKFGETLLVIAQSPRQLADSIRSNIGTLIVHRLNTKEDLDVVQGSLNLNDEQRAHVANLGVGEAVVSLAGLHRPILVQVQPGAN